MKKRLTTNEDVYALLHARTASAALGAAITTGLLWMLAEKPMTDLLKYATVDSTSR